MSRLGHTQHWIWPRGSAASSLAVQVPGTCPAQILEVGPAPHGGAGTGTDKAAGGSRLIHHDALGCHRHVGNSSRGDCSGGSGASSAVVGSGSDTQNYFPTAAGSLSLAHGDECLGRPCIPPRYLAVRTTVQVQVQRDWYPSMAWHARGPYSVSGCRQSAHSALTRLVWGQHSPHLLFQI